jgi:hypothetical protein
MHQMPQRRVREAAIAALFGAVLVMGLCNAGMVVLSILPLGPRSGDIPHQPFTLQTEQSLLELFLFAGALGAVFGFVSTLNKPE